MCDISSTSISLTCSDKFGRITTKIPIRMQRSSRDKLNDKQKISAKNKLIWSLYRKAFPRETKFKYFPEIRELLHGSVWLRCITNQFARYVPSRTQVSADTSSKEIEIEKNRETLVLSKNKVRCYYSGMCPTPFSSRCMAIAFFLFPLPTLSLSFVATCVKLMALWQLQSPYFFLSLHLSLAFFWGLRIPCQDHFNSPAN